MIARQAADAEKTTMLDEVAVNVSATDLSVRSYMTMFTTAAVHSGATDFHHLLMLSASCASEHLLQIART